MKKSLIFLLAVMAILPASALEITLATSIAPPSIYIQEGETTILFPDGNFARADFNFSLPHDFFANAQVSAGFPRVARVGLGVGKDFPISDVRSIRLSESLAFGYAITNCMIESLTEVTWQPYKKSGLFVGAGISASLMLGDLVSYKDFVWFLSIPVKVGYSFCFQ